MIIEDITTEAEAEQEFRSSCPPRYPSTILGFFIEPTKYCVHGKIYQKPFSFVSTSEEGQALKEGGNLDESLSFLPQQVIIVGSSNSFLLCCITPERDRELLTSQKQNFYYIICNPVTRNWRRLPDTHHGSFVDHVAFFCEGDRVPSLDEVRYEVLRAGRPNWQEFSTVLEIESFSSRTNSWNLATVVSDAPFRLNSSNKAAFAIGEVIFWEATYGGPLGYQSLDRALLAYDRRATALPCAKLIQAPRGQDGHKYKGCEALGHFGQSEGKVQFARHDSVDLEIWVLDDYRNASWVMRHRVRLNEIKGAGGYSDVWYWIGNVRRIGHVGHLVKSFHPWDSRLVFITLCDRAFWYDIESRQKKDVKDFMASTMDGYFLYEWPLPPSED